MTEYGPAQRTGRTTGSLVQARARNSQQVAAALERRADRLRTELGGAAYTASVVVKASVEKRVIMPRQVSKQDSARKMRISRRSPVKTKVDRSNATAIVSIGPHWTAARTPAMQRLYPQSELTRTYLKIKRPLRMGSGGRAFRAYQDEKRLKITRYSWLTAWANRKDRGEQVKRHAIRMKDPEARMRLLLEPAAKEREAEVIKLFRVAAIAAVIGK